MNYNTSLLIMALVIMGGLYFSPVVGLALLVGATLAVLCTAGHHRSSTGDQNILSNDDSMETTYELDDHVRHYYMDDCPGCGGRKFASEPLCYGCKQQQRG